MTVCLEFKLSAGLRRCTEAFEGCEFDAAWQITTFFVPTVVRLPCRVKCILIIWRKTLDTARSMCYNIMRSDEGFVCRSGEIGRRPGLKIPCDESHVPVRARFPAPILLFRFAGTARQTVFHPKKQYRGVEQLVARRAHNPEVVWFKSHPRNQQVAPKKISGLKTQKPQRFLGFFMPIFKVEFKRYHFPKSTFWGDLN